MAATHERKTKEIASLIMHASSETIAANPLIHVHVYIPPQINSLSRNHSV